MKTPEFKESRLSFEEKNLEKLKIEGKNILLGEDQSGYQDVSNVYLLGLKNTFRDIGVFKKLPNMGYEMESHGLLSCVEIIGEINPIKKFVIHARDTRMLKKHLVEIQKLSENEIPEKIILKLDFANKEYKQEYLQAFKTIWGDKIEIEIDEK